MAEINITKTIFNKFPTNMTVKSDKNISRLEWFGKEISTPENRLIMGVTALASQPFIDLYNKDVDEETRKISCARTAAKIMAGTITGVAVRAGSIALVKRLSKLPEAGKTLKSMEKLFTPKSADASIINSSPLEKSMYADYQKTFGTILGLVAMLYTNFALDIPLTRFFTNFFAKKLETLPSQENQLSDALKGGSK